MLWLLPAIGAAVGALTNLNHPEQTWKNALLGAGLGFGASQIPGATEGVSSLLGIGGNSTVPLETATGAATKLNVPAMDKFMATSPSEMLQNTAYEGAKGTWTSLQNPMLGNGIRTAPSFSLTPTSKISSFLNKTPEKFYEEATTPSGLLGFLKSPVYAMGAYNLWENLKTPPQPNPNSNMALGDMQPQGQPRPQQPVDSGIYSTNFVSPRRRLRRF